MEHKERKQKEQGTPEASKAPELSGAPDATGAADIAAANIPDAQSTPDGTDMTDTPETSDTSDATKTAEKTVEEAHPDTEPTAAEEQPDTKSAVEKAQPEAGVLGGLFGEEATALSTEDDENAAENEVEDDEPEADDATEKTHPLRRLKRASAEFFAWLGGKTPFWMLLAFAIPVVVFLCIYVVMQIHPFGADSCLTLDMNGQYVYFFEKFREIITSGDSILYSWERALGGEFPGIFYYYLCSPFTFLVVLFPKAHIITAIQTIFLCKMGLCAVTFYYYLHKARPGKPSRMLMFSLLYALGAYGIVQSHNTMWIDAMYLLPLMLLGLEALVKEGKFKLYTITLAAIFIFNYYIGYMVAIFTALYFLVYYFSENEFRISKRFWKVLGRFALFSLLAALIACITFLPAYYSLTFGKTNFQNTQFGLKQEFDFVDFFTKLLPASYDSVRPEGWPMVYSGLMTVIFLPIYFFCTKIAGKKKILNGLLVAFLVFSMNATTLTYIWHGFACPNWLNARFSFMFCFLIIVLAWEGFRNIEKLPFKSIALSGVGLCVLVCIVQKFDYENVAPLKSIWITLLFVMAYLALLYPLKNGKRAASVLLLGCIVAELGFSGAVDLMKMRNDVGFGGYAGYVNYIPALNTEMENIRAHDDSLYRTEKTDQRTVNDNMALQMYGIAHSTSTLNEKVVTLLGKFGYNSYSHASSHDGFTPVSDALLGVRYTLTDEDHGKGDELDQEILDLLYKKVSVNESSHIATYKNPYDTGIVYGVNAALSELNLDAYSSPFEAMNAVVGAMLGKEGSVELFKKLDFTTDTTNTKTRYYEGHIGYKPDDETQDGILSFHVTATDDSPVYCYFATNYKIKNDLRLNGETFGQIFDANASIMPLGTYKAGETVDLDIVIDSEKTESEDKRLYFKDTENYFYSLDTALFREIMPLLQTNTMEIADWDSTHIDGKITVDGTHSLIFTSIPTDAGWHVKIDGETVATTEVLDALIAIDASGLSEGTHRISFSYCPRIYLYAVAASVTGVLLFVLILLLDRRRKKKVR